MSSALGLCPSQLLLVYYNGDNVRPSVICIIQDVVNDRVLGVGLMSRVLVP